MSLSDHQALRHYPWLRSDRNDKTKKVTLREGEADFVIVHPKTEHGKLIFHQLADPDLGRSR